MKHVGTILLIACGLISIFLIITAVLAGFVGVVDAIFNKDVESPITVLLVSLVIAGGCGGLGVLVMRAGFIAREKCTPKSVLLLTGFLGFCLVGFGSVIQVGLQVAKDDFEGSGQELLGASLFGPTLILIGSICLGLFFWENRTRTNKENAELVKNDPTA